jgi:hypothetical protein
VIVGPEGEMTVLEFKTGEPRPEHQAQVAVYAEALAAAFHVKNIASRILYA